MSDCIGEWHANLAEHLERAIERSGKTLVIEARPVIEAQDRPAATAIERSWYGSLQRSGNRD